jgi:hypothetical protein
VPVGAHQRSDLAVPPGRPLFGVLRRHRLHAIHGRCRPRALDWVTVAQPGQVAVVAAARDARETSEPRNRQARCHSQGFEVGEGT